VIDDIIEDCLRIPILFISEAGHGKSSSLKTIINKLKKKYPSTSVKAFDISMSWYQKAPLPHRQLITPEGFENEWFENVDDCVYEIGKLTKDDRRKFVADIIKSDYDSRREMVKEHGLKYVQDLARIIYVFEEANTYFDSYSLRKGDDYSTTLSDFVSAGRNFGLRGFLVVTAEVGELSPSFRRRTTGRLLGKIINDYDIRRVCRGHKDMEEVLRTMPIYHFVYHRGGFSDVFRILDTIQTTPFDVKINRIPREKEEIDPSPPPELFEFNEPKWYEKWAGWLIILGIVWLVFKWLIG